MQSKVVLEEKLQGAQRFRNYEIQGAQHKAYMKEIRLSGHPKAKVSRLRHLGTLRAQPCLSKQKDQKPVESLQLTSD